MYTYIHSCAFCCVITISFHLFCSTKAISRLSIKAGVQRRGDACTAPTSLVRETILTVLRDCPGGVGYKSVWQTLNNKYKLNVRQ